MRYQGNWRCIDLVETAAAAATGAIIPGVGAVFKNFATTFSFSREIAAGAVAGSAVRASYMVPPDLDGPTGRVTARVGSLTGNLPCECSDSCDCK